jgi:hypothetical protein
MVRRPDNRETHRRQQIKLFRSSFRPLVFEKEDAGKSMNL